MACSRYSDGRQTVVEYGVLVARVVLGDVRGCRGCEVVS
jgi:hypothetical protein